MVVQGDVATEDEDSLTCNGANGRKADGVQDGYYHDGCHGGPYDNADEDVKCYAAEFAS